MITSIITYVTAVTSSINNNIKGDLRQTFTLVFKSYFFKFYGEKSCRKLCGILVRFQEIIKLQSSEFSISKTYSRMYKTFHRWFSSHFFVGFMEKKPFVKSCGVFDHFSQVYQVLKF